MDLIKARLGHYSHESLDLSVTKLVKRLQDGEDCGFSGANLGVWLNEDVCEEASKFSSKCVAATHFSCVLVIHLLLVYHEQVVDQFEERLSIQIYLCL